MEGLCRCCGGEIKGKPILYYKNMPKAAQFFPTEEELEKEKGIDLKLYQCSRCGLIQLIDEPVSYYRDVIRTAGLSEELQEDRKVFFRKFLEKYEIESERLFFDDYDVDKEIDNTKMFLVLKKVMGNMQAGGVAKYAIIQLLREGIPAYIISNFTNYKEDVLDYCQEQVDAERGLSLLSEKSRILDFAL